MDTQFRLSPEATVDHTGLVGICSPVMGNPVGRHGRIWASQEDSSFMGKVLSSASLRLRTLTIQICTGAILVSLSALADEATKVARIGVRGMGIQVPDDLLLRADKVIR
jgi:biotin-(acetyl-CoA carboxylase) ligase